MANMKEKRSRIARWPCLAAALAAFVACSDGPPDGEGHDTDGDSDSGDDTDSGSDSGSEPNDFVESHLPISPPPVALNRKVAVLFVPGSLADDYVLPDSVIAEIDGEPARLFPYHRDTSGNREFRFVPFPLWTPGSEVTVRILEGVTFTGSGESMAGDFAWSFQVEDAPFEEIWDPQTSTDLTPGELETAAAGGPLFQTADIVNDWQDPDSTLYLLSEPADPEDPEVLALAAKLRDSMTGVGGIGLAAPQIGVNRRLFGARLEGRPAAAYVNPVIVDWAEDEIHYWQNGFASEGCLSIPGVPAKVARPRWIVVEYHTAEGELVQDDYLETNAATTFLHEYDHLNGILITDRQEQKP
jgi:peptide deformylase